MVARAHDAWKAHDQICFFNGQNPVVNLSLRDRSAVLRFVEKFCFPLVREYSIPTALVGTASLLHVNSRHYLVSAAHVLKILKANLNDIGVPLGKRKAIVYVLGSMSFAIPDPPQDKKFDIGVALLDVPHAVTKLKRSPWKVLIPEHIGRTSPYTDAFAFVGFPERLAHPTFGEVRSGRLLAISPTYRRRSIHELNKRLPANALPIDEKIDIVLEYPRAFLKANGEQVGAFDLEL